LPKLETEFGSQVEFAADMLDSSQQTIQTLETAIAAYCTSLQAGKEFSAHQLTTIPAWQKQVSDVTDEIDGVSDWINGFAHVVWWIPGTGNSDEGLITISKHLRAQTSRFVRTPTQRSRTFQDS